MKNFDRAIYDAYKGRVIPAPIRRPHGMLESAWIDQKIAGTTGIALCEGCKHKFDFKRHDYEPHLGLGRLTGKCDGCEKQTSDQTLFIHSSLVSDPGGRVRSGHVYNPDF